MKKYILLAVICCVVGCGRTFHYTNLPSHGVQEIPLKGDHQYYTRKLLKLSVGVGPDQEAFVLKAILKTNDSIQITDSIQRKTLNDKKSASLTGFNFNTKIVEIEHLYVFGDNVIYITTTPSKFQDDLTQKYILNNGYANGFYYNTFFFGKIVPDAQQTVCKFIEKDGKHYSLWRFDANGNALSLKSIEKYKSDGKFLSTILAGPSVSDDIVFIAADEESTSKAKFPIKSQFKSPKIDYKKDSLYAELEAMHYNKVKEGKYNLYLTYNKNLSGNYKTIRFNNVRLKNNPECIQSK